MAIHRVPNEDSDQTAQMGRLIWVFDGHTCQLYPFAGNLSEILLLKDLPLHEEMVALEDRP